MCMLFHSNENSKKPKVTFHTEDGRVFSEQKLTQDSPPIPYFKEIPEIAGKIFRAGTKTLCRLRKIMFRCLCKVS